MNATSRDRRSSLATATEHLAAFAAFSAALQLRPARERVSAFAGLDLGVFARDVEPLSCSEGRNCLALRFKAETGASLLLG